MPRAKNIFSRGILGTRAVGSPALLYSLISSLNKWETKTQRPNYRFYFNESRTNLRHLRYFWILRRLVVFFVDV
jgi:hypothetical protein